MKHIISSNDIAVLELEKEVDLDTYTPACLAKKEDKTTFDNKPAEVYGWGSLVKQPNENGTGPEYPDTLQEVTLGVVTHEECAEAMDPLMAARNSGHIEAGQICTDTAYGAKDSCSGDSGGPLTQEVGGQAVLIGEVSWGFGCAQVSPVKNIQFD